MTVDVDKSVVCRLKHAGRTFEIMVDPRKALEFKKGGKLSVQDVLAYPSIYKDVSGADLVPEADLQSNFGTADPFKIAEKILRGGELQLTTEQKRELTAQKRLQIAELISRRGINPQTDAPHPPQRILAAMDQAGVDIEPFQDAELQFDRVVKALKAILPISFQRVTIAIRVQPQYAGRVYSILKGMGTTRKEQWLSDGSLSVEIEVLGGLQQELFDKMANLTHGSFESKVVSKVDA